MLSTIELQETLGNEQMISSQMFLRFYDIAFFCKNRIEQQNLFRILFLCEQEDNGYFIPKDVYEQISMFDT